MKVIISGGGTGGHIFPAISIAGALREKDPGCDILFVGAEGKMEMERVPAAGYPIIGLPVAGLKRSLSLSNLALPFKVMKSIRKARKIIREFRPDIAVGVGGYASAPILWVAQRLSVPTLIQEQNSYAGLTNRLTGRKADRICVAYEGMERFFPKDRLVMTGNPVRNNIRRPTSGEKAEALKHYSFDPEKKTILVLGGSLGCATLNNTMKKWISDGQPGGEGIQILWQCGKGYYEGVKSFMETASCKDVVYSGFIDRMDYAYAAADLIISRSGAGTISELCVAGKAVIFVPSPNVTEDHQTHNAMALVEKGAAGIVKDSEAMETLMGYATALVKDEAAVRTLENNISALARPDAASAIAEEIFSVCKNRIL